MINYSIENELRKKCLSKKPSENANRKLIYSTNKAQKKARMNLRRLFWQKELYFWFFREKEEDKKSSRSENFLVCHNFHEILKFIIAQFILIKLL
jgi:hypothetical protein